METWGWVYLTFMASVAQAVRTGGQKHLTQHMNTLAVTLVRFAYGLPFVAAYFVFLLYTYDREIPTLTAYFLAFCLTASVGQIVATVLLIYLFSFRNFAVGTTYARTEAFLTAVVGALFFGELINLQGWLAIAISVVGVVVITVVKTSVDNGSWISRIWNKSAAVGLASGLCFALASLSVRRAALSFGDDTVLFPAAFTLLTMVIMQSTILGIYIVIKERAQIPVMVREWKVGTFVGATSALGSIGWFTAFTLQKASFVKALGQIEFIFTLAISILFFREKSSPGELAGMALVVAGIVYLLVVA
ncbi:MAG: EamA family transporter [Alphaproteobacteria bacterium]|nr:EamA family transporter [Alphaproteobacteria bacterium]